MWFAGSGTIASVLFDLRGRHSPDKRARIGEGRHGAGRLAVQRQSCFLMLQLKLGCNLPKVSLLRFESRTQYATKDVLGVHSEWVDV